MSNVNELLRQIPKVDEILKHFDDNYDRDILKYILNIILSKLREDIKSEKIGYVDPDNVIQDLDQKYKEFLGGYLKKVINATGVVVHTNLGRCPIPFDIFYTAMQISGGYCNLELDLVTGERGDRYTHCVEYFRYLTGAEDALVVNNNAAAVFIILNTFAQNREVLVSRGELVEIGGSFRLPDVMRNSGAILKEVGTTNKTKPNDYILNISEQTAMLMKSHTSNYKIVGFTEEVSLESIAEIGKTYSVVTYYDAGSGLLSENFGICEEKTIKSIIKSGVDLVSISGDKLLGGPQCGIILGKKVLIDRIKKNQLLRMLRVDKITLSILQSVLLKYVKKEEKTLSIFNAIDLDKNRLIKNAERIKESILKSSLFREDYLEIRALKGYVGGGACPMYELDSYGVAVYFGDKSEQMAKRLRMLEEPIICRVEKGFLIFDLLVVSDEDIGKIAHAVIKLYAALGCK
ncbi:MAG: L-seryl-tRNA(Sec) selenium transferase [Calditerrivibrio sp.]|nr:L-seryl-tRNA(Sec) selenium transferase [Calditerrivibrio sp.]